MNIKLVWVAVLVSQSIVSVSLKETVISGGVVKVISGKYVGVIKIEKH